MKITTTVDACDFDERPITGKVVRRLLVIDGRGHRIVLCEHHSRELNQRLLAFATPRNRVGVRVRQVGKKVRTEASRRYAAEVRAWARAQGIEVSDKGRIATHVVEDYEAANA